MKILIRTYFLAAFMIVLAATSAWAAPVISSATIDTSNQIITINGTNLVSGIKIPTVLFNGATPALSTSLQIVGTATKTTITAQLPETVTAGTYVVKVKNGYGMSAAFDITYGVGLTGPQGPAGPEGGGDTLLFTTGSQIFTSSGSFTVPQGITHVMVEMWGGGGGGGYNDPNNDPNNGGSGPFAGGGGGGGYLRAVVSVTPRDSIPVVVGAGGSTPDNGDGLPGGDSTFGTAGTPGYLFAGGGKGGQSDANGGHGGTGGSVTGGISSFEGGNGTDCLAGDAGAGYYGSCGFAGFPNWSFPPLFPGYGTDGGQNMWVTPTPSAGPGYVKVIW